MRRVMPRARLAAAAAMALTGVVLAGPLNATASAQGMQFGLQHLVVIYEENHSFDNLYGL